ncbi:pro-resilin-like [Neodiprion pinetum]|uniref:pro-resilin-like n=1 Tax=Neodiprion pinetum TaxID=441929 RepID=UPI001EDE8B94|nr:pro-resilin-like [Neodiprion pinetum]
MKIVAVLCLIAVASASLEPAGYRPPGSAPSTRYLPASNYQASSPRQQPSARYLPASQSENSATLARFSAPSSAYLPANNYQAPARASPSSSTFSNAPSASYGVPASSQYSAPAAVPGNRYLPANNALTGGANSGYGYADAENSEPAKYDFQYEVKDNYDNDFGHQESRDGDDTKGMYFVLLPDGRKQIVEYTADQEGYKPRISYEESRQGYNNAYNQQNRQAGGYPQSDSVGPY